MRLISWSEMIKGANYGLLASRPTLRVCYVEPNVTDGFNLVLLQPPFPLGCPMRVPGKDRSYPSTYDIYSTRETAQEAAEVLLQDMLSVFSRQMGMSVPRSLADFERVLYAVWKLSA